MFKLLQFSRLHLGGICCCLLLALQLFIAVPAAQATVLRRGITSVADTGKATISAGYNIVVSSTDKPTSNYIADIKASDLGSEEEVKSFFRNYSDNVVSFKVDYDKLVVYIQFLPPADGAHEFAGTEDRNNYLKTKLLTYTNLKNEL
ncbi:hypothetical protein ACFSJU_05190 [Paradesertivirga mongoliensis]|uniref:Uncharacterized protein n=1 Tax=Paradesertivirga mongoliensis TaxID=2100740 RepID=A0ABW4ZIC3_9SPHI|nr:hypothetical protein [Pedobacter mongoliensis]